MQGLACGLQTRAGNQGAAAHAGHACTAASRSSTALYFADNPQHAHQNLAASRGNNGIRSAHTADERNEPQALGSLGAVDESALEAPAGSAAGQALQGEGAGFTQVGNAEAPAAAGKSSRQRQQRWRPARRHRVRARPARTCQATWAQMA